MIGVAENGVKIYFVELLWGEGFDGGLCTYRNECRCVNKTMRGCDNAGSGLAMCFFMDYFE